jgi:hypothetical protein
MELGSNSGSDFDIRRYDDTGTFVGIPFAISRSNGQAYFAQKLTVQSGGIDCVGNVGVTGSGGFSGTLGVGSLNIGNGISVGLFGDGTSLALRAYGNNTIYLQNGGGSVNYATLNYGGLDVVGNIIGHGLLNVAGSISSGGNAQFSGAKTEVNAFNAYGPINTINAGNYIKSADYLYAATYVQAVTAVVAGTYINAGTYVNAGGVIVSSGGLVECRAIATIGDSIFRLSNDAQVQQGALWWERATGQVHVQNLAGNRLTLNVDGRVRLGTGFYGRAGVNGSSSGGNAINFWWTGSTLEAWVDASKVGTIPNTTMFELLQTKLDDAIARIEALEAKLATL